jgi:hypothetical protein
MPDELDTSQLASRISDLESQLMDLQMVFQLYHGPDKPADHLDGKEDVPPEPLYPDKVMAGGGDSCEQPDYLINKLESTDATITIALNAAKDKVDLKGAAAVTGVQLTKIPVNLAWDGDNGKLTWTEYDAYVISYGTGTNKEIAFEVCMDCDEDGG